MRVRVPWTLAIFVAVLGLYLATGSREPEWGDANGMVDAADHLLRDGTMAIGHRWPEDIPAGRGGKYYCISPILTSLIHVPGLALGAAGNGISPDQAGMWRPLAVHLGPALLGAFIAALYFATARRLGASARAASWSTLLLAVGTTIWVYSRYPYSEILQATTFLGFFASSWQLLEPRQAGAISRRDAILFGTWAGMLVNSKVVYAAAVILVGLTLLWRWRRDARGMSRTAAWVVVGAAPWIIVLLFYNWLRWGAILETGYGPYLSAFFGGSLFDGAWGMLASPNKSAFLYSPPLLLALWGWPALIRKRSSAGLAAAITVVPLFLIYSSYRSWSGDYAWGPRFFVFAVPVVALGLPFFIDQVAAAWPRWVTRSVLVVALAIGGAVQTLGNAFYWDHYIRITMDAKAQWLGRPNRAGSYIPERGRGHCDSCFEDMYALMWNPPFQPIRGHWWLLSSLAQGHDAAQAVRTAPWRRYSTLPIELGSTLGRVRIDWWGLLWLRDGKGSTASGVGLMTVMVLLVLSGAASWRSHHRSGG